MAEDSDLQEEVATPFPVAPSLLATTPQRWTQLTRDCRLSCSIGTGPEGVVAYDCLRHIVARRMVFPARIGYLLRGEDFPRSNPDAEGQVGGRMSHDRIGRGIAKLRAGSLELLSKVAEGDLKRTARHRSLEW